METTDRLNLCAVRAHKGNKNQLQLCTPKENIFWFNRTQDIKSRMKLKLKKYRKNTKEKIQIK